MKFLGQSPRAERLLAAELGRFASQHPRSRQAFERAYRSMPDGVPSGVYALDPFPLVVTRGQGAYLWDLDELEYVDYNNGFGVNVFGHAHPEIVAALAAQVEQGIHFGALTEVATRWAEHLCERYELQWVRFATSGSEAVADALRLARSVSGRPRVAKIEGGYHGSSEPALISNSFAHLERSLRAGQMPKAHAQSRGLSPHAARDVVVVPFNDLERLEQALRRADVGVLLLEPVLFNVGAIFPEPGYLAGVRALCDRYGVLLVFDEVKTGATVAWAGAEELFGVKPDIKVLGKGIGGGLAVGALGACRQDLRAPVESFDVPLLGTFAGNPLVAAAGEAALTRVLVPQAYDRLCEHFDALRTSLEEAVADYELPAYVVGAGAKGCVVWAERPLSDFRAYCRDFDGALADLLWLYLVNRGVFLAPGQDEQWTHSISHGPEEAARFSTVFREFARALRG